MRKKQKLELVQILLESSEKEIATLLEDNKGNTVEFKTADGREVKLLEYPFVSVPTLLVRSKGGASYYSASRS